MSCSSGYRSCFEPISPWSEAGDQGLPPYWSSVGAACSGSHVDEPIIIDSDTGDDLEVQVNKKFVLTEEEWNDSQRMDEIASMSFSELDAGDDTIVIDVEEPVERQDAEVNAQEDFVLSDAQWDYCRRLKPLC